MTAQYTAPSKASSSPLANLISETPSRAVYRGTSGQKITDTFTADPFLMKQLTTSANHHTMNSSPPYPPTSAPTKQP